MNFAGVLLEKEWNVLSFIYGSMARSSAKGSSSATGSMPEQQLMLECQLVKTSTLHSRFNKLTSQHQVCILVLLG